MKKAELNSILEKYGDTIKEELNIKEISGFQEEVKITKIIKPIGSKLGDKFGKDTGKIIQFGKQGNVQEIESGQVKIFDGNGNEWILEKEHYEVVYEGLKGDNMAIDQEVLIRMDLNITEELQKEGVAREISRFLNQMRKDADYPIDAKVNMSFQTEHNDLKEIIGNFTDFLSQEALIKNIKEQEVIGDIISDFDYEGKVVKIGLKK